MANQLLRNQLKLKFTNQIVTFVRKNDDYYASEILFTNKEELMNILISFTKNKNKIVRWKAYWTLRFLNDSENFVTLLNFFSTQLDLEKDELVKEIIAVSLNNLILECKKYQQDNNDCLKKYKIFLTKAREYLSNKFIYNVEPFHMKDFGYVKTCLIKTKEHFNEIVQAIRHSSESIRIRAIRLLGELGDKRAIQHLEPLLEDTYYKSFQFDIYYSLYRFDSQKSKWFKKIIDLDKNTALNNAQKEIINNIIREKTIQKLTEQPIQKPNENLKHEKLLDKEINIGILTSNEHEDIAVKDCFRLERIKDNKGNICWRKENILPSKEIKINIIHYWGEEGSQIASYVNKICENWTIDYLFLIGYAGGILENGVTIGDIVLSNDVTEYTLKIADKKRGYKFDFRPIRNRVNKELYEHFKNFKHEMGWYKNDILKVTQEHKELIATLNENDLLVKKITEDQDLIPKVVMGHYFSGSLLVQSEKLTKEMLEQLPSDYERKKCYAIEMEAGVTFSIIETLDIPFAVIKCISDNTDKPRGDEFFKKFRKLAADRVAHYLKYIIKNSFALPKYSKPSSALKIEKKEDQITIEKKILNEQKAKNLLIRYLDKIITDYEEEKKLNLIDRTIKVGQAKSEEEGQEKKQVPWKFEYENALSWLEEQIRENRHILIKGEMGIGKTVLMLAIAHKLALEAKICIENNQFSELVFPVLIPLKERGFYSKYKKETQLKGNRFAWLSQIISFDFDDIEEEEKKQFNEYLKAIIKEKPASFTLLFDAFDEFAYKQWEGKLSPRNFFGLKTSDEGWEGAVIITSRPSLLNDLQKALLQINLKGEGAFCYAKLPRFTDSEIERFLLKRPLFENNIQYRTDWLLFKKEIIDSIWNKHYGNDWRIPLFLWALSQAKSKKEMPKKRVELFLYIFKYAFNWYYCKKDKYKSEPSQEEREKYCTRKDLRTIIIDPQNEDTSTYKVRPLYFHLWEYDVFKQLALSLSKENKYQFSKQELNDTIKNLGINLREITIDIDCYYNLLLETMNDGSFIISISTDDEGKLVYSISPWRMQEAFTATKFIELSKTERIDLLKKLLPQIEDMRETIKLCWQMLKEKIKCNRKIKKLFISACPDFKFLFKIKRITPIKLLTNISKIDVINGERRIVGIDLSHFYLKNIIDVLQHLEQLRYLHLEWNEFTDLTPLAALTQLQELNLMWNHITELAPLAALTQLQRLNLSKNLITDLAPLAALTQLQRLNLKENRITDLTPLAKLTQHQKLNLWRNQIIGLDVSPIIFHKDLVFLDIDDEVQLLCKRELIDKITCPALIRIKVRIKPID